MKTVFLVLALLVPSPELARAADAPRDVECRVTSSGFLEGEGVFQYAASDTSRFAQTPEGRFFLSAKRLDGERVFVRVAPKIGDSIEFVTRDTADYTCFENGLDGGAAGIMSASRGHLSFEFTVDASPGVVFRVGCDNLPEGGTPLAQSGYFVKEPAGGIQGFVASRSTRLSARRVAETRSEVSPDLSGPAGGASEVSFTARTLR